MTLSFVNYELKIKFERKQPDQVQQQIVEMTSFFNNHDQEQQRASQQYDQFSASVTPQAAPTETAAPAQPEVQELAQAAPEVPDAPPSPE